MLSWRKAGLRGRGCRLLGGEGGPLPPFCPQPGSAPGCPDFSSPPSPSAPAPTLLVRARRALGLSFISGVGV